MNRNPEIAETHIVFVSSASAIPGSSPCPKLTHVMPDAKRKTCYYYYTKGNNNIVFLHVEIISRYIGEFSRSYMINTSVLLCRRKKSYKTKSYKTMSYETNLSM